MPSNLFILLCYSLHCLAITNGARILGIFPIPGRSHFACNEAVMRSLYDAGHQITFVSPFSKDISMQNYTVIDSKQDELLYIGELSLNDFKNADIFTIVHLSTKGEEKYCYNVLGTQEIQDLLNSKDKPFDVMFVEITIMTECYLPLAEKLNIPVIGVVTLRSWKSGDAAVGNPLNRAVVPDLMSYSSDQMSFIERVHNLWYTLFYDFYYNYFISSYLEEIYQKFYTPELVNKKKISVVFMNNHLSLSARAAVPNAIDIGGIHLKPVKPLPKDLQKFIDEAEHGVVLFSLGSIAKSNTMTTEIKAAFQDAFAEIPQRVIWKFDDAIENLSNNVLLMKWMPQRDILAHKNVKAFISHCGMSGTYEAMSEGVPMILTPLLADQYSNSAFLHKVGAGVSLDIYSATREKVLEALNTVINDTRYRANMNAISKRFKDRPMSPQETIVYWTEYVIKHNGALHLRTVGADMPLNQYLLLDVTAAITIAIGVTFYIFCWYYFVNDWIKNGINSVSESHEKVFLRSYEAIYEAVPLILMPLFGGQQSNADILEELGVGVYLDLFTVTTQKVLNALHAVINDTRYTSNIQLLSQRFKDRSTSSQESVVYWTEYVIRHKGAIHLRTIEANLPSYQYLMLDILTFIAVIAIGLFFALNWLIKKFKGLIYKMYLQRSQLI